MSSERTAAEYAVAIRSSFEKKAGHNKAEALWCFGFVVGFTLAAPLFVTLAESRFWGKIVPAVLSICAAGLTTWLQVRKPQQLWALYRTCQRRIEDAQTRSRYSLGEFEGATNPEQLLAKEVAEIAMFAHQQWIPLVPSPENLGAMMESKAAPLIGGQHAKPSAK